MAEIERELGLPQAYFSKKGRKKIEIAVVLAVLDYLGEDFGEFFRGFQSPRSTPRRKPPPAVTDPLLRKILDRHLELGGN